MADTLWLIRRTVGTILRRPRSLLLYFGLPLAGILLSLLIHSNNGAEPLRVGIVNLDDGNAIARDTAAFVGGLNGVQVKNVDEEAMEDEITGGTLDCALVIPAGFGDSAARGKPATIELVSIKGAQVTAYVKGFLSGYVDNIAALGRAAEQGGESFAALYAGYRQDGLALDSRTVEDRSGGTDATTQSIGYLIVFMLFSATNLSALIVKEKENRTYFRLLSSPISSRSYVVANLVVNVTVLLAQIAVTLTLMKLAFGMVSETPVWQLFAALALFALVAVSASMALVAYAANSMQTGALQNLLITPTSLLAGCFFSIEIMPPALRRIADFLPQRWLLDTVNRIQAGEGFGSLYVNLLILAAFMAVFALLAVYRFSRNNDTRTYI